MAEFRHFQAARTEMVGKLGQGFSGSRLNRVYIELQ